MHRGWIVVPRWLLPSISEILSQKELIGSDDKVALSSEQATVIETCSIGASSHRTREGASPKHRAAAAKAQREWQSAIATLEQLLLPAVSGNGSTSHNPEHSSKQGLILAGPAPVLSDRELLASFETGIFTNDALNAWAFMPFQLPPAQPETTPFVENTTHRLPLFPGDPLANEQFCLVFTKDFSLVMVSGEDHFGVPGFQFS
ncbi:MAG: sensor histidine kinase, partial [Moorea sp. SIO4G2]|nr:sensor histidine kinase [Moorena sp. SIO4G2]